MRTKPRSATLPLQQAEFEALPDSVQRKYFSSLERLQIQQQALTEPATSGRSSQASSSRLRPSISLGTGRRRRKSEKTVHDLDFSFSDVEFFFSLPDKAQKQLFSRDEQLALHTWREHAFLADNQEEEEWAQQRFDDFHFDFTDSSAFAISDAHRSQRPLSDSSANNHLCTPSGLFTADETDPHNSTAPSFLDTMATPFFTSKEVPSANMRRTMSLTTYPLRRGSSPSAFDFAGGAPARSHQRSLSSSLTGRTSSFHTPTSPIFDPEATHYQDPEARKKLRMYLASPQKFDEAIEFGFPSSTVQDTATPHYHLPKIDTHSCKFSRDMQTFLKDGQLSFFDDDCHENQGLESDADSVADMDSPATPSSTGVSFRLHSRQPSRRNTSVDSPTRSPVHAANWQLNREMTLRMTLTRPDLRADEDQLYGWQSTAPSPNTKPPKDDPLALEDLVFTDDMTGTKGAFYVKPKPRGNLVSRLLKRASLKSR
ncbi:hypothetical protein yc1106_04569 [Curvularia clavata]|uniref:Uncharacterized protein n=1 Tax=Curvularia clavata TaxID=95742 RepID=A0A9Q8Z7W6_CURCL|nr:hypothetical protein yc1106_04569 [Curvularia clavata]